MKTIKEKRNSHFKSTFKFQKHGRWHDNLESQNKKKVDKTD